jgi:hypothetical protein
MCHVSYTNVVGSLMEYYVMVITRPCISHAVGVFGTWKIQEKLIGKQ